ncbi:autotransporter outer membrane beta-barrel domain-containing protein [Fusobacterium necrophorum]|uniref:Autotransporter n=2 Tax=Fusobacterium necrophorum TaxID=859 RepID=A0AB73C0R5_9FUSO|nr:autotransporter outer membrane beta-barrel domain-containing protein [Fusobacterium necrophorum]KDE69954.1 autotransporter [Fusobacterium necrophorum DJ-2]MBR8822042.1 hypothetical protein [Fusobacterium necrophorum]
MNMKKRYWIFVAYLCIHQLGFSTSVQILQNGEEKGNTENPIILNHDYSKSDQEAKENEEKIKQWMEEGKIEKNPVFPFLFFHSSPEALAQTGIIVNFEKAEDDKAIILKDKEIQMKNGILDIEGNLWGYPSSNTRKVVIENSKISMERSREIVSYREASGMYDYYYQFQENGRKKQIEDIEKERELYKTSYSTTNRKIQNALLHLKNSELNMKVTEGTEYYTKINSDGLYPNLVLHWGVSQNPKGKDLNLYPISTGLHISREGEKLADGKYDLLLSHGFSIFGGGLSVKGFQKESVLAWNQNLFHKEKGIPLFRLGKNTKMKAEFFRLNNSHMITDRLTSELPELHGVTYNPMEDEMIVFQKDSEASFDTMEIEGANVKFQGGKVNLLPTDKHKSSPFAFAHSQLMGNAVFNIKGDSILRGAVAYGHLVDKNIFFTDLSFLSGSKIDVGIIKDSARDLFKGYVALDKIKDEAIRGGLYKFTLEGNTKTYLGFSKREMDKKLKERIEELQEQLEEMENITPEQLEELPPMYKEKWAQIIQDKKDEIKVKQVTDLYHTSDADMHFKENSDLYLFREKYKDDTLVKNGEITDEKDEQGNLSEFTGRLTFDSNSRIHLRSNLKEEISDQLIATHYPILGEGAVLHLDNKGESSYTGQEKIVLVKANKGTSSKTKFSLQGGKVMLGDFDYHLYERLTEEGKEYYLAHGVVEGVLPEKVTPKKFISEITNIGDFISVGPTSTGETVKDKKIKAETTQEEYAISYHGDSQFENSQLAALGGKGILSTNAKLSLINSSLMSNQGLALEGTEEKELLTVDKGSSLLLENSTGGAALSIKNAKVRLNDVKKATLRGSYAIYSNGGNISGSGLFDIDGNIYHKGKGGINLTLEKGSLVNASMIDIAGNTESSKLHLKDGSNMFVKNYSNANMIFEKGSQLHLYLKEEADQKLDILQQGNRVIFTEPINFSNTDIYFRTNMDKEESDRLELLSTLTGTGANLHLNNHAEADMPSGGKEVDLVIAKTPENFKWNLANPVEVGGYFYNASLKKKSNGLGSDIISITVGDSGTRKATLSSTAKGVISNTVSDYIMHHSLQDSIFDSLYSNDYSSERSHSIWAKTSSDTFETKDYGMKNEANTILVGMDRALNAEEGLYGGFFAGNLHNTKKISSSSGKGSFQGFTGGLYLSYRGYLGFGDAFVAYTTGKSKYNVLDTASDTITNDRNSKHLGAGLRFGRQFFMDSGEHFYLEPSAKITYGRLQGESSEASNGLLTKVDAIKSWTTGAYARAGYQNQFAFGKINSYAKIGVTQEILGKYNVRLNQNGVEQIKLDGNTMNYGLGCEYTIGNNTLSLDFDVKHSPVLKNHYKVSVGYQYKF